uniref:Uncharacterized protein n=1 Tax=Anguilla anguilla TaxID=7936 RepID=A0A0E9WVV9_ANGAN
MSVSSLTHRHVFFIRVCRLALGLLAFCVLIVFAGDTGAFDASVSMCFSVASWLPFLASFDLSSFQFFFSKADHCSVKYSASQGSLDTVDMFVYILVCVFVCARVLSATVWYYVSIQSQITVLEPF